MSLLRTSAVVVLGLTLLAGCAEVASTEPSPTLSEAATIDQSLPLATQLELAIKAGNADEVERILVDYTDLSAELSQNTSPLHIAIRTNQTEIVTILIDAGAPLELRDFEGRTALMAAACFSNAEIIYALLDAGADLNATFTPFAPSTPWHYAASYGNVAALEVFLGEGVDIDLTGAYGRTALAWATYHGRQDAVEYLLAQGADPNITDVTDSTPLAWAEYNNDVEIAEAIAAAGGVI